MKYIVMFIALSLAFFAGTQVSGARSMDMQPAMNMQAETSLIDQMSSEWLVPDHVNRMLAYHQAYQE